MKKITHLLLLAVSVVGFAQAPANYYNSATGTGYTLKTQLKTIITNGHDPQPYTTGLWNLYANSLRDNFYENDGSLLDMYSENPAGPDPYNFFNTSKQCGDYTSEGDCYNKEHLVPQAFFGNGAMPMYSDAHHVVPSDGKVNGWRDNLPFGVVSGTASNLCNGGATNVPCRSLNNSKIGNNLNSGYSAGYTGKVFEPIDEFKGDIARAFFYFATRYQDQMTGFYNSAASSVGAKSMFDGSANKVFSATFLNILLTWHSQDPVSNKERAFNNSIYNFQGNRNPFIDRPEFVQAIWGTPMSTNNYVIFDSVNIYPNPATNNQVNIYSETVIEEIQVISLNGQLVQKIANPVMTDNELTLSNIPQGFYLLKLSSQNTSVTKKFIMN